MIDTNDTTTQELNNLTDTNSLNLHTVELADTDRKSVEKLRQPTKIVKYDHNPFVDDELLLQLSGLKNVRYTQTSRNAIVDTATGEYEPATLAVIKTIRADKEEFVKLFTTHLRVFFELTAPTFKILQYILAKIQKEAVNKDTIDISPDDALDFYLSRNDKISRASYFRGVKELIEKQFIAKNSKFSTRYYINPKLFFNGDRIEFITKFECEKKQEVLTKDEYNKLEDN